MKITSIIPVDVWPMWEVAVDRMRKEGIAHPVENIRNGMVLEMLIAEYLAGPHG